MPSYGIHEYQPRQFSLARPQLEYSQYTPVEFKPVYTDPEYFAKHLQYMDTNDAQARKTKSEIDRAFAQERQNIEPELQQEYDKVVNDYEIEFNQQVSANMGSLHRLTGMVTDMVSKVAKDKNRQSIVNASNEYTEYKKDLDEKAANGFINRSIADMLKGTNKLNYVPKKDAEGNVIGYEDLNLKKPVRHIDIADIQKSVAAMYTEEVTSTSRDNTSSVVIDENGKVVKIKDPTAITLRSTNSGTHSEQVHEKKADKLRRMFEKISAEHPEWIASMNQDYDTFQYQYDYYKDLANKETDPVKRMEYESRAEQARNSITDNNGIITNSKDWIKNKIIPVMDELAYKNTGRADSSKQLVDPGYLGTNLQRSINQALDVTEFVTSTGPSISGKYNVWSNIGNPPTGWSTNLNGFSASNFTGAFNSNPKLGVNSSQFGVN